VDWQKNWFFKIKNTELRSSLVTPWSELAVVRPHHRYFEELEHAPPSRSPCRRWLEGARPDAALEEPALPLPGRARAPTAAFEEPASMPPWRSLCRCCLGGARMGAAAALEEPGCLEKPTPTLCWCFLAVAWEASWCCLAVANLFGPGALAVAWSWCYERIRMNL
jgi:hypothetical protein